MVVLTKTFSLTVCVACGVWRGKRKGKWKGNGLAADFVEWTRFVGIAGVEIGNGFGSVLQFVGGYPIVLLSGTFVSCPLDVVEQRTLPASVDAGVDDLLDLVL